MRTKRKVENDLAWLTREEQGYAAHFGPKALGNKALFELAKEIHHEIKLDLKAEPSRRLFALFRDAIQRKDFKQVAVFVDLLTTASIVEHLNQMEERPWCDERHGHGVHASWLSRKLRPFSIHPGTIRTGIGSGETAKGYLLEHFQEAFARYLPETPSASRHTVTSPVNTGVNALLAPVTPALPVTAQKPDETLATIGMLRCDGSETPQPDELLL